MPQVSGGVVTTTSLDPFHNWHLQLKPPFPPAAIFSLSSLSQYSYSFFFLFKLCPHLIFLMMGSSQLRNPLLLTIEKQDLKQ